MRNEYSAPRQLSDAEVTLVSGGLEDEGLQLPGLEPYDTSLLPTGYLGVEAIADFQSMNISYDALSDKLEEWGRQVGAWWPSIFTWQLPADSDRDGVVDSSDRFPGYNDGMTVTLQDGSTIAFLGWSPESGATVWGHFMMGLHNGLYTVRPGESWNGSNEFGLEVGEGGIGFTYNANDGIRYQFAPYQGDVRLFNGGYRTPIR